MFGETRRVYLRNLFRSPLQISKMCTKIRRQLDYCYDETGNITNLPWAMSADNGLDVHSKKESITFVSHQNVHFIKKGSLQGKRVALVEIERKETFFIHSNPSVHLFHIDKLEWADSAELEFTGVEFNDVYIRFNIIGNEINRIRKVKLILYNAMSRAKDHVTVLLHENDWALFNELYKYEGIDIVLDKLSKSKLLGEYDLKTIDSQVKMMQVIKSIIVSKQLQQFRAVFPLIRKFKDANFHHCVQKLLASCFTWCKKGSILEMLHLFQSETDTEMTQEDAWKYLYQSTFFLAEDWNQTLRKEFFDKFQEVTQIFFKNFEIQTDDYYHEPFPHCWIAENEDLLQSFQNSVNSDQLFDFIVYMGKFYFNENCFRKIIKTLFGERASSIDVENARHFFFMAIPREDNFGAIMDLMEIDAVKLFTEFNPGTVDIPLIFHYFRYSSFGLFKDIFTRIRQANIRFSELLGNKKRNILWHIGWGDCGFHKTGHVLQDAFEQNNDELEILLTQKANDGASVLHYHCEVANDPRIVQLLIKYSKTVWDKIISDNGKTLIHHACNKNQIAVLDFLLKLDKEKDYEMAKTVDENGQTCLHCACEKGNTTIVKMLLNTVPALASEINNSGMNALHCACVWGHLDAAQTLYRHFCGEGSFNCTHDLNNEDNNRFLLDSESKKLKTVEETNDKECLPNVSKSEQLTKSKIIPSEKYEQAHPSGNANISDQISSTLYPKKNLRHFFTSASVFERILKQHSELLWNVNKGGNSNLHFAAFSGNVDLVKWMVSLDRKILPSWIRENEMPFTSHAWKDTWLWLIGSWSNTQNFCGVSME